MDGESCGESGVEVNWRVSWRLDKGVWRVQIREWSAKWGGEFLGGLRMDCRIESEEWRIKC